jgi:hypothetical protein
MLRVISRPWTTPLFKTLNFHNFQPLKLGVDVKNSIARK